MVKSKQSCKQLSTPYDVCQAPPICVYIWTTVNIVIVCQLSSIRQSIYPTQNGRVVLIRDVLRNTENPSYQDSIRAFGFDLNSFNKLLNGTHAVWSTKPVDYGYFPPEKPIEHISVRNGVTPDGKTFEATLVTETSEAVDHEIPPAKAAVHGL